MEEKSESAAQVKASDEAIKGVIYFIEQELDRRMNSMSVNREHVDGSPDEDFSLAAVQIPLDMMLGISHKIDKPIAELVKSILLRFFKLNAALIDSIYIAPPLFKGGFKNPYNALAATPFAGLEGYYFIILKHDTDENRTCFFDFISQLSLMGITERFPLRIQFVPSHFKLKFTYMQQIQI